MKGLFSLNGRMGRLAYLANWAITLVVFVAVATLLAYVSKFVAFVWVLLIAVSILGVAYFAVLSLRRLHDTNLPAWWLPLLIVPYIKLFFMAYLVFKKGSMESNTYGAPPTLKKWERYVGWAGCVVLALFMYMNISQRTTLYKSVKELTELMRANDQADKKPAAITVPKQKTELPSVAPQPQQSL